MRKIFCILLIFSILINITGCEAVKKKFTRKKKTPVKAPRIYQVKKYEKKPTPELYKKHYAYWASWQSELVSVLGENRKKDMRCIEEIISNLRDMQNILVKEKADRLEVHIVKIVKIQEIIYKGNLTPANKDYIKRTLEREDRLIEKEFVYKKVKDYLKKSFEEEEAPAVEEETPAAGDAQTSN